ncbi:glycosyltransferase family 92 protein C33H5.2-like [Pelodytes ibericus]
MKSCTSIKHLCKLLSLLSLTITVLYVSYLVFIVKTIVPVGSFMMLPLLRSKKLEESICNSAATHETIVHVRNSRTFVISAYLDLRGGNYIRVIGITYRHAEDLLFCDFCFRGANETVKPEVQIHSDHFNFPYATADFLCLLKDERTPQYVSIHGGSVLTRTFLEVRNMGSKHDPPSKFAYDFILCISALFGSYNNVLQFIESMEMYQMLGVQKVVIYHTDSSPAMNKVLAYYKGRNFLDLISWPITSFLNVSSGWHYPEHPGDLHYYGQTAALNDCIYRHMYTSKYIALNDIDEIILPVNLTDWSEMMERLIQEKPAASVFVFENHLFPATLEDKQNPLTPAEWNSVPGVNIIQHVKREPNQPTEINPSKMIVNPRDVVRTSVHVPLDFIGEQYNVPQDIAKLCHYRQPKQKELAANMLITDPIMFKHEKALIKNVNKVLAHIKLLKTGDKKTEKIKSLKRHLNF